MSKHYIVREDALPEVLLSVLKAKRLLALGKVKNATEAIASCGISRASYYKYKDAIFEFESEKDEKRAVIDMSITGGYGSLLKVIDLLSRAKANILSINQSVPVNGIHDLSLTLDIRELDVDIETLLSEITELPMISNVNLIALS